MDYSDPSLFVNCNRPWPVPQARWRLRQRWTKLLFAHWPIPVEDLQRKLPRGLGADTHDGWAWIGVVPFLMDRVRVRIAGDFTVGVPTATAFPELNLRTYVIAPDGKPGIYFFSLDASSLSAVVGARVGFALPYFWSRMHAAEVAGTMHYRSRRVLGRAADFAAHYRSLGTPSPDDSLRSFLTERYSFYTRRFGQVQAGEIDHAPWSLQNAEADFDTNNLPSSFGFTLPNRSPVLHYAPEVHMQAWTLRRIATPRGQR